MTKGVTLFEDEAETLTKVLARRYGLIYPGNGQERSFTDDRAGASAGEAAEAAAGQDGIFEAAPAAAAASMPGPAVACVAESTEQMDAAAPAME